MPSLIEVHLGCNKVFIVIIHFLLFHQICAISDNAFREVKQSVQNLILDNNCLSEVPTKAVEEMNALIALHLKYNQVGNPVNLPFDS